MSLGRTIAELRTQKGLRQADLAKIVGVHQSNVTRWELDLAKPRRKYMGKLADALSTNVQVLLDSDPDLSKGLLVKDQELAQMLLQVHSLDAEEQQALKVFLDALLTRSKLGELMKRGGSLSLLATGEEQPLPRLRPGRKKAS